MDKNTLNKGMYMDKNMLNKCMYMYMAKNTLNKGMYIYNKEHLTSAASLAERQHMSAYDTSKEVAHVSCCYHKTVWIWVGFFSIDRLIGWCLTPT
jgi:hypothetical protein